MTRTRRRPIWARRALHATGSTGSACAIPHAVGVCVAGLCRLVSCEDGFGDCDGLPDDGCERDVTTATDCGRCEAACQPDQRCQLGARGRLCSETIVCLPDRLDLDRAEATGCEWALGPERTNASWPYELAITRYALVDSIDGVGAAAGQGEPGQGVWISQIDDASVPPFARTLEDEASSEPAATAMSLIAPLRALVGWRDGQITYHARGTSPVDEAVLAPCQPDEQGRALPVYDLAWERSPTISTPSIVAWVITPEAIVPLAPSTEGAAPAPIDTRLAFGTPEYLRAVYPYETERALTRPDAIAAPRWRVSEAEVAQCEPCLIDTTSGAFRDPPACAGSLSCQPASFDPALTSCPTCGQDAEISSGCPRFEPLAVLPSRSRPGSLYVVTRRGLVVLDVTPQGALVLRARAESAFDPGTISGASFLGGALAQTAAGERIFMLHNQGFIRSVDVLELADGALDLRPAAPDIGLLLDTSDGETVQLEALDASSALVIDASGARLLNTSGVGGRQAEFPAPRDGLNGIWGAEPEGDRYLLWWVRLGALLPREITYDPSQEDARP